MGQLSDFLAQPVPPTLIKRPPKGWESGVEERDGRIVVTTDPLPSEPDETVWKELVADWGIDPERYEILPGSMQFRGWDAAVGGGQVRRLRYYRATLVERTPAAMRADVDELIAAAAKRKPPRRLYTGTGPPVILSANDWQLGKALSDDTPVLTTEGWKAHGDLRPGDSVYGPDGHPVKVLGVTGSTIQDVYRVRFDRGVELLATADHRWTGWRKFKDTTGTYERRRLTMTTAEIGALKPSVSRGRVYQSRPFHVELPGPLDLQPASLPVDPYVLGLWLGDGSKSTGSWTSAVADSDHWLQAVPGSYICYSGQVGQVDIRIPGLTQGLRAAGVLDDKHVPDGYLGGSTQQRLALLQGLMDTDGWIGPDGNCEFVSVTPSLIAAVEHLVASLGMKSSTIIKEPRSPNHSIAWRVHFTPNAAKWYQSVFRMERKRALIRDRGEDQTQYRYVQSVEPAGSASAQCITVEGSLYLAGRDLVVTHNSEGGGTPATLDHLLGSFTAFRDHRKMLDRTKRRPAEVVIANTGDLTERMFGHYPSQMSTVDLNEREQQRVARRLLMRLVDDAVDDGYPVLMTAVPCNHGENRGNTSKGMKAISTPDDNLSLVLVEAIEEACAANPDRYGAVRFAYAPNHVLAVPIDGINVAMTHGHQVGSKRERGATSATGAAAMESWWRGQVMDRDNPMAHADILLTAHRHHLQISEESGRPIFLAPASDGGSYWYTSTTGRFSTRGVLSLTIGESHPRGWGDLVIL